MGREVQGQVIVTDLVGKMVISNKVVGRKEVIPADFNGLKEGIYVVRVITRSGISISKKMVISR
jgi:hypothetical protein